MKRSSIESSLKRFLKRKVKITLGMVVAFLITGAVGYGDVNGSITSSTNIEEDKTITLTETAENEDRFAGIINKDKEKININIEEGKKLTINSKEEPSGVAREYGVANNEAESSINIAGNLDIKLKNSGNIDTRLIRANAANSTIDIKGNIYLEGNTSPAKNGTALVGVEAWEGSKVNFSGEKTTLNLTTTDGRIIGVQNHTSKNSKINFNADETNIILTKTGLSLEWFQGVLAYQSETNFNGNTTIKMTSNGGKNRGINVECDPGNDYKTIVNFSGETTKIELNSKGYVQGVFSSGVPGEVNFNGNEVYINTTSSGSSAVGMQSQYGAVITGSEKTNLYITSNSKSESAYGIFNGWHAKYNGNYDLKGSVIIDVDGKNVYGISNEIKSENTISENDGKTFIGKNLTITSNGEEEAYGIYSDGEYSKVEVQGNVDITAEGGTAAYSVYSKAGNVILGLNSKISLKGDVLSTSGSELTFNFGGKDSVINGLVTAEDSGIINLNGTGDAKINELLSKSEININGKGNISADKVTTEDSGKINVKSGSLASNKYSLVDQSLIVSGTGALKTNADIIFKDGMLGGEINSGFKFDGGSLSLSDDYTLDDVKKLSGLLKTKFSDATLVMTGQLKDPEGIIKDDKVDIKDLIDNGIGEIVLDGITLDTSSQDKENTSLVIGEPESEEGKSTSLNSNIGVSNITVGEKTKNIKINNGKALTLTGGEGKEELIAGTSDDKQLNLTVGDGDGAAGSLNLGNNGTSSSGKGTLKANLAINDGGSLNITNGNYTIDGEIENTGKIQINDGGNQTVTGKVTNTKKGTIAVNKDAALTAKEVENKGTLSVAGDAVITKLTGEANSTITVGDSSSAGTLVVEELQLNGGKIFLDPDWKDGENLMGNASKGAVIFDKNEIDGQIAVGQNSVLVVGDKDTDWAEKAFENSGLKWKDDITAALAIRGNQTLGTFRTVAINDGSGTNAGSINVDGNLTGHNDGNYKGAGELNFADKSLLIVDVGSLDGGAAISGVTKLSVADTSKLYLENATAGTHTIVLGTEAGTNIAENSSSGWSDENISSSDRMLKLKGIGTNNGYKVEATAQKAQDVLLGVVVPNMINNIWETKGNTNTSNEGIRFLSLAADNKVIADTAEAVRTINSAVQISAAGVVNRTAIDTVRRTSDTAINNLSLKNESNVKEGLWAEMSYGSTDVSGVKIGNTDTEYNGRYEGISVGSNFKTWENGALGGAFHYVLGENKSDEGVSRTKNEYEYFGLSLYSNWRKGNFNIIGDLGYSMGDNEIKQDTSIVGRIKADVDTEVATAGVKGEYLIQKDNFNIMPYAGLRYVRLNVDSFDTKNGNGKMFHTEKEDADLFLVPVGVNISTQAVNQNGWTVKPKLDLAYIGALGDKKSETKVGVAGYSAIDEIKVNMADSSAFSGSLGVEFKKDNKTFEVGYSLYSSKHETENRGTLSFKYNF
ncbi:autotransporter domain-containing protein [Fusobacterium ulcerans]|uniref:autotransporter domain-containing protein n=1 Tax=Fusobacterium ulcerans TaxID=861 RepID=UPI0026F24F42|nr:autotransporter domain-containing protein [Fusobacterium ulcerans]